MTMDNRHPLDPEKEQWLKIYCVDQFPALIGYIYKKVKDEALAKDIVMESLIKLYRKMRNDPESFPSSASVPPLLYTILNHTTIDHLRQSKRSPRVELSDGYENMADNIDLIRDFEKNKQLDSIKKAIPKLSASQKQVAELTIDKGLDIKVAAKLLNQSYDTVKHTHKRALDSLRKLLHGGGLLLIGCTLLISEKIMTV